MRQRRIPASPLLRQITSPADADDPVSALDLLTADVLSGQAPGLIIQEAWNAITDPDEPQPAPDFTGDNT